MRDQKHIFRLIVYSYSSANRENLAKIGPVDVEIIGLKEVFKKETKAEHISPPSATASLIRAN